MDAAPQRQAKDDSRLFPAAGLSFPGAHRFFSHHFQRIVNFGAGLAFQILDGLGIWVVLHSFPAGRAERNHVFDGVLTALVQRQDMERFKVRWPGRIMGRFAAVFAAPPGPA